MTLLIGSLALLVGGIIVIGVADRDRAEASSVGFLRQLDTARNSDDYRTMLEQPVRIRALGWVRSRVGRRDREHNDSQYRQAVRREVTLAGLDKVMIPEMVIVGQVVGGALGAGLNALLVWVGAIPSSLTLFTLLLLIGAGAWLPRTMLVRRGRKRSSRITRDLPDLLELMSMGISAGLSVDASIEAVIGDFDGPLSDEFRRYLDDESLGTSRRVALERVRDRTDVRTLSQLVVTLSQAEDMGMPVATILRSSATEARQRHQQEARERAAKLPVKMLLPLVFCVFPPILVVIMGPAVATIAGAF